MRTNPVANTDTSELESARAAYLKLLGARPPTDTEQTMFVTILSWGTIVLVSMVGGFTMILARNLPMATRLTLLGIGTVIATVLCASAVYLAEERDARRSGHVGRWVAWWKAVRVAHADLLEKALGQSGFEVPALPDVRRFPRQVRRWLRQA